MASKRKRTAPIGASKRGKMENSFEFVAAVQSGNIHKVCLLVEAGADINVKNNSGYTALMESTRQGIEIARFLVEAGADVNVTHSNSHTALSLAASQGNVEIMRLLIDNGSETDSITLLMVAAVEEQIEAVHFLVEAGVDINTKDIEGDTALMVAIQESSMEMVRFLVESGASIEAKNNDGESVLFKAFESKQYDIVMLLLKHSPYSKELRKQLVAKVCHPDRVQRWLDNGGELEEFIEIYGQ